MKNKAIVKKKEGMYEVFACVEIFFSEIIGRNL